MKNENERVSLNDIMKEVSNQCAYKDTIVRKIVLKFLDELKDSMIQNEQVSLKGYFAFRHHIQNPKSVTNLYTGEKVLTPEMMKFKTNVSKKIIRKLNERYQRENRKKKALIENRLTDFEKEENGS